MQALQSNGSLDWMVVLRGRESLPNSYVTIKLIFCHQNLKQKVDLGTGLVGERGLGDLRDHVGVPIPKVTVVVLNHLN